MSYENLLVEIENRIAVVTLNRPQALNALNKGLLEDLSTFFDEAKSNDNIRAVILTGAGEKSFVAGADIKEFASFNAEEGKELAGKGQERVFDKIENFTKPVIAAVNGFALGGGLELAMAAHFRIASTNAKLGLPEVTLGLIPGYGGTQRLPKLIGKGRAMQAIMTADMFTAEKAEQIGLVNEVVEQAELINRAKEIAGKITRNSSIAISQAINAINASDKENGFAIEIESFGNLFEEEDFKEGTTAFVEKRKPNFK
ncbi:enoyl-CoA hydratase/isomerase family protein [Faecalibacter bovis]|uniref:Enoyl-CoA hydratase/isomerase family protein n=1 Tax=Faecalibacter bovis TaxID=2898187 RepID=A0ABX7XF77_9FLAO|nr:enoyl-CoA hydratase-related protein [Faecalibacter bovis]MBS7334353.1 enoyl-CoA hydratase/isomerase family protein [Weeksellaceae bacterium]QTV06482.1 enoyl-CoA hydratase/isomerase family protein [Faecalibacter bovis]